MSNTFRIAFLAPFAIVLIACASPGRSISESLRLDNTAGTEPSSVETQATKATVAAGAVLQVGQAEAIQPSSASSNAIGETQLLTDGGVSSKSTAPPAHEPAFSAAPSTTLAFFAGLALLVGGGALAVAKRAGAAWTAPIAKGTGVIIAATGAGVMILPWFLDQWGWTIGLGAAVLIGVFVAKTAYNIWRRKVERQAVASVAEHTK